MIPLPTPPKIIEKKDYKATFEIAGLYPGYGVTIGNALRRALLSSLGGAAITKVKIKGVQHEFSTLPGIMEDVLHILLNLKQVRCKVHADEPVQMDLLVKGEREVKAGDFKAPSQIEIVNKDAHIATLTAKNAALEMECWVEKGIGYVPAERLKKEKLEVGTMVIDAIFTPIRRVSFKVENMRVGERTDFDRLFLEVETDGTMSPEEALRQAVEILANHFNFILTGIPAEEAKTALPKTALEKKQRKKTEKKVRKRATKEAKKKAEKQA